MYHSCDNAVPSFYFCVKEVQEHEMVGTWGRRTLHGFAQDCLLSPLGRTLLICFTHMLYFSPLLLTLELRL